jgi:hypothetical protein
MQTNCTKRGSYKRKIDSSNQEGDKYDALRNKEISVHADIFIKSRIDGDAPSKPVETRQIKYWHSKPQAPIPGLRSLLLGHTIRAARPVLDSILGNTPTTMPMCEENEDDDWIK